jgi:adenine-specific DNA-methyltransferase
VSVVKETKMIATTTKDNDSRLIDWSDNILNDQQLELFFLNKELELEKTNSILKKKNKKNLMGQVFTPHLLAKFMVSLFQSDLKENNKILDPCIGPNTFLSYLDDINSSIQITGVELDESLISEKIKEFYKKPNRQLILDSFFNLPLANKFDFIVQNPPYVRQELMMDGENSKLLALKSLSSLSQIIPAKSNLYVYFLLKSIFHLADHGRMIAVIYDSWLYSDFGKVLKEAFVRFGSIEGIYHSKKMLSLMQKWEQRLLTFKRIINPKEKNKLIKLYTLKTIDEVGFLRFKTEIAIQTNPSSGVFYLPISMKKQ